MIPVPKGVKPLNSDSIEKKEQLEQIKVPQGVEPIKIEKDEPSVTEKKPNTQNCVGWNKMGCSSESIKKVQSCMNVGVSGIFDAMLRDVLASYPTTYAYKDGFNDTDVDKICLAKQTADRIALLDKEKNAKMQMKKQEMDAFLKQYPQQTTKATKTDQF